MFKVEERHKANRSVVRQAKVWHRWGGRDYFTIEEAIDHARGQQGELTVRTGEMTFETEAKEFRVMAMRLVWR